MAKKKSEKSSLEAIFKETSEAVKHNYELLNKCSKNEYPFDKITDDGHVAGGKNSKTYSILYSMIVTGEQTLSDLAKAMNKNANSVKYNNSKKYEPVHRCGSCQYISYIGKECVCKNPNMNINSTSGCITSNCLEKFDSHLRYYYKTGPDQIQCRHFKEFHEEETA